MDANGQRFWLVADAGDWQALDGLRYDRARGSLRLASRRAGSPAKAPRPTVVDEAGRRLDAVPETRDTYGNTARWDASGRRIVATGAGKGDSFVLRPGDAATDLLLAPDEVLYVAVDGGVLMHQRRGRLADARAAAEGFAAWRLAPDPAGGAWVLDRDAGRLAHTEGRLWPDRPYQAYDADVFRPDPENPSPPRLRVLPDAAWAGERAAAVATSPAGRVAVLAWREDGQGTVRVLQDDGAMSDPVVLEGAWVPYSLAWVSEGRVAVLLVDEKQAAAYDLPEAEDLAKRTGQARTAAQAGDVYPLQGHDGGPFQHGPGAVPHYPTLPGSSPLHALSLPSFAQQGRAWSAQVLDAGVAGATWHRLYLEACIPPRCSISLYLAASETHATPRDEAAWFEHRFGGSAAAADREVPRGAWVPQRSELPYHPGVLQAEPAKDRAGLWTALVQRAGRRVRALRGRYLHVRAELRGDGLASPELAAVRAYGPRFSYRDRYLPELYRESVFGAEADLPARSTPADFLERFLGNFEGILTGIEDRIAHAHLLTDPRTVPAESLEWLAGWIGVSLDPALPEARRRDLLAAAPELARLRGTPRGIALALELATGGGVSGGEIVLVEDFRLRRTFATILGADLEDEDDPLLCGLARSGNSYVGDTLFLGDERSKAFLALFDADLPLNAWEQAQVAAFFERLAHRMTVLVHQEVEPQDLGLIRRIVQREAPAHVEWRVVTAPSPLVVGAASLVGVDTYLGRKRARRHVSVDRSRVGADFVLEPVSLDRRTGGGAAYAPPVARLSGPETVGIDGPVPLDGGGSRAAPGHDLTQYRWTRRPE